MLKIMLHARDGWLVKTSRWKVSFNNYWEAKKFYQRLQKLINTPHVWADRNDYS